MTQSVSCANSTQPIADPGASPHVSIQLAGRLAEAEARIARLETKVTGSDLEDDAMQIAQAARFCGYSVSNFRKIARSDADLARCYHKGTGRAARLIFSRKKLDGWKAART